MRDAVLNIAASKGIDKRVAERIAKCESGFQENPKANPYSTAKGLFQFVNGTWNKHCEGDVLNWKDNAVCFANNFNQHPTWWESCI